MCVLMHVEAYWWYMPHSESKQRKRDRPSRARSSRRSNPGARYTVGLSSALASQVEQYAETVDTSISKAIAALVRLGLESQTSRKREFFEKLKANLAKDDPGEQDRLIDGFRTLILGR